MMLDPNLMHWRSLPPRRQSLEFTAQGWALAEACATLGAREQPQALIVDMLGRIITGLIDQGAAAGPDLHVEWQMEDGCRASLAFQTDALKTLSGLCNMEVGEMQSAIQGALEQALMAAYDGRQVKARLH